MSTPVQDQFSAPQHPKIVTGFQPPSSLNIGLLGNNAAQYPTHLGEAESFVEIYRRLVSSTVPAFKLMLLRQQQFAPEGRQERIATSLAALNRPQPTQLTVAQWKEILEEIEDE
jgi:hypothetical protein